MAYLVACYVEDSIVRDPKGFTSEEEALGYLVELERDAHADGLRTSGDPLDGKLTVCQGENCETYRMVETSDEKLLRMSKAPYLPSDRRGRRLP